MKFIKKWRLNRQIDRAVKLLGKIDATMKAMGMPRWKRKQIWKGFIKSENDRKNITEILNGARP